MKSPDPLKPKPLNSDHTAFERHVSQKSKQKVQSRQEGDRSIWAGLGLFGMVGWSVMVPTLLGIALGLWIDQRFPSPYSWTLMLLFVGVVLGCWNAWYWIQQEQRR